MAHLKKDADKQFAPGRFVMTCCAEDITFMALPCKYAGSSALSQRTWVEVEATVRLQSHALFRGKGPVLTGAAVRPAEPAEKDVVTF